MEKRESRRDRTIRYGERARRVHLRTIHPTGEVDCVCEKSVWFFAKKKSLGCRCRRRAPGQPKRIASMCHAGGAFTHGYHPSVHERIEGNRLCRSWMSELRGNDPDDVDL